MKILNKSKQNSFEMLWNEPLTRAVIVIGVTLVILSVISFFVNLYLVKNSIAKPNYLKMSALSAIKKVKNHNFNSHREKTKTTYVDGKPKEIVEKHTEHMVFGTYCRRHYRKRENGFAVLFSVKNGDHELSKIFENNFSQFQNELEGTVFKGWHIATDHYYPKVVKWRKFYIVEFRKNRANRGSQNSFGSINPTIQLKPQISENNSDIYDN